MTGFRLLHRVHRKGANSVYTKMIKFGVALSDVARTSLFVMVAVVIETLLAIVYGEFSIHASGEELSASLPTGARVLSSDPVLRPGQHARPARRHAAKLVQAVNADAFRPIANIT